MAGAQAGAKTSRPKTGKKKSEGSGGSGKREEYGGSANGGGSNIGGGVEIGSGGGGGNNNGERASRPKSATKRRESPVGSTGYNGGGVINDRDKYVGSANAGGASRGGGVIRVNDEESYPTSRGLIRK